MNDVIDATPAPAPDAAKLESLKQLTMIIYILYAASLFVGITAIVAIVMNYVKRDDAAARSTRATSPGRSAPSGGACCGR